MAPQKESRATPTPINKLYRFAFARITVLSLLALLCVGAFVSVVNDMYAFVKQDRTVTVSISEPTALPQLSAALQQYGVINNPTVFSLYVKSKQQVGRLENFCGSVELNEGMSYREILLAFRQAAP